jgi:hypothetical protein
MTTAERVLLIEVACALAADGRIATAALRAVLDEIETRERQAEDLAHGRMIAAAMD